jgi:small subunit ribosomal protein S20
MRSSVRKHLQNHSVKSRLHTLQINYAQLLGAGKKEEAAKTLRLLSSALDKAAKTGVIHRARANRTKSRLNLRLNALKAAPTAAPAPASAPTAAPAPTSAPGA